MVGINSLDGYNPATLKAEQDALRLRQESQQAPDSNAVSNQNPGAAQEAARQQQAQQTSGIPANENAEDRSRAADNDRNSQEDRVTLSAEAQNSLKETNTNFTAEITKQTSTTAPSDTNQVVRNESSTSVIQGNRDTSNTVSTQNRVLGRLVDQFA